MASKSGAAFNRGESRQDFQTPRGFLDAVERRFGGIEWDLAATSDNRAADEEEHYFGPDHVDPGRRDALAIPWENYMYRVRWLNPPFANIAPWAAKCEECRLLNVWTLLLVPGSIGTNWWRDHVRRKAMVFGIQPRLKFVGAKDAYPKDLALCAYGFGVSGDDNWRWLPGAE